MQVRETNDPRYQDDDVRFRNTYYFRVYDYCMDEDTDAVKDSDKLFVTKKFKMTKKRIIADALYRFRVTGKADSLFTDIRFEAGKLKASEIDRFGARAKVECKPGSPGCTLVAPQAQTDSAPATDAEKTLSNRCSNNSKPLRKSFQVAGPEGEVEFDQDERFVIAMGSGISPISDLKELAGHQEAEKTAQNQGVSLALSQELTRILNAKRKLSQQPVVSGTDAMKAAIELLGQESTPPESTK